MDITLKDYEIRRQQFLMAVNRRFPTLTVLKVIEIPPGSLVALVQVSDNMPFLVGTRHGHIAPVKASVLHEAETRYKKALDDVIGALHVLHAWTPNDPEKWKTLFKTLNIQSPTSE